MDTAKNHTRRRFLRKLAAASLGTLLPTALLYPQTRPMKWGRYAEDKVYKFVCRHLAAARTVRQEYRIPVPISLGQAALETGWGESDLAKIANNFHGIKSTKDWKGPTFNKTHGEFIGGTFQKQKGDFRFYPNAEAGFEDYGKFLANRDRYYPLFRFHDDDYEAWCIGLQTAGYATDPKYAEKVKGIIEKQKLYLLINYDPATRPKRVQASYKRV